MSSAETVVTNAYRFLSLIDIADEAPSPADMKRGLQALNTMIDGWAGEGLNVIDQTLTGTFTSGEKTVREIETTAALAPGMTATATGISARIKSIDSPTQITLDTAHTQSGAATSIAFTVIPFQARFEEAVAALLALRIALYAGEDNVPALVVSMAKNGWLALQANFIVVPNAQFDAMLLNTATQRMSSELA